MKYSYSAKTKEGQVKSGTIEAGSEEEAAKGLRRQNLYVFAIEKLGGDLPSKTAQRRIPLLSGRVSLKDKIIFTKQLAMMIQAGLPLVDAFSALEDQTENKYFSSAISEIANEVKGGKTLSETMAKYPRIFPDLYISIVRSGEKSGKLDDVLNRIAEQLQKDYDLITQIRSAMTYPILIIVALVGIVILMLIFVIPSLKNIFSDMGVELPITTRIILAISDSLRGFWYVYLGGIIGMILGLRMLTKTAAGKLIWDRLKLRIPLIGGLIRKIYMARFTRTMGTLVASGLPMLDIIKNVQGVILNRLYQDAFKRIFKDIENGVQLSKSIQKQKIFPAMVYHLVAVGEQSGKLDYVLLTMADFFDKEVEATTNNLATLIEPILIIFIGAGVGMVVASVIMPIYSLVNAI